MSKETSRTETSAGTVVVFADGSRQIEKDGQILGVFDASGHPTDVPIASLAAALDTLKDENGEPASVPDGGPVEDAKPEPLAKARKPRKPKAS